MTKDLFLIAAIALLIASAEISAGSPLPQPGQAALPAAEQVKSRPTKQEIIDAMTKISKMPGPQLEQKMDAISASKSGGTTPRSDFLFCLGLAYLGNKRAQTCLGEAFENGRGVVDDLNDAYVWYSVARDNQSADSTAGQKASAGKDRVRDKMLQSYPVPNEDDLDALAKKEEDQIRQYQAEVRKASSGARRDK